MSTPFMSKKSYKAIGFIIMIVLIRYTVVYLYQYVTKTNPPELSLITFGLSFIIIFGYIRKK